jgi:hypothetical protein
MITRSNGGEKGEGYATSRSEIRTSRGTSGVNNSRFYWVNPDEIAILTDAEPGAWGQGSGNDPQPRSMKAMFSLSDLAKNTSSETWADARSGEETYKVSQS